MSKLVCWVWILQPWPHHDERWVRVTVRVRVTMTVGVTVSVRVTVGVGGEHEAVG